jgi:YegS/Rv2252/BmrU family lipid kinase
MKKLLFIINPIAGKSSGANIVERIKKYLDVNSYAPVFIFSEYPEHISEISRDALSENYHAIIAVGGDGTVNEVGRVLVHSNIPMGIIPAGSGNGLARHLKIPLSLKGAMKRINKMDLFEMDAMRINEQYSFCVAGIGFDAEVSRAFQRMKARGLYSYIIACLKCFKQSRNQNFMVKCNDEEYRLNGFMLCFANTSQFGNNAYIAPEADVSDGVLNLILMKKPSFLQIPRLAYRILNGKVFKDASWRQILGSSFEVTQTNEFAHLDGEPVRLGASLKVNIEKKALKVIC